MSKPKPPPKKIGTIIGNWEIVKFLGWVPTGNRSLGKYEVKCTNCGSLHEKSTQQMKPKSVSCYHCIPESQKQVYVKKTDNTWAPDEDPFLMRSAPKSVFLTALLFNNWKGISYDPSFSWLAANMPTRRHCHA